MGANLIVDDPELAQVISCTHLPTSKGWKAKLVEQGEAIGRSIGMISTGNWAQVDLMVAQWFTHCATK